MTNVIEDFRKIAKTGDLPPGYRWGSIEWRRDEGWTGWCWGPKGANDLLPVQKLPTEAKKIITKDINISLATRIANDTNSNNDVLRKWLLEILETIQ